MSRDTFSLVTNSVFIVKSEFLLGETLFEVNAVIREPKAEDCINYVKVRSHLNLKTLKVIIKNCHCAGTPIIEKTPRVLFLPVLEATLLRSTSLRKVGDY